MKFQQYFNNLKKIYHFGKQIIEDKEYIRIKALGKKEDSKQPKRYDVINYLLETINEEPYYLEIGVRRPELNFDKIKAATKFSVDPGLEYEENPVDFKMTSDVFFEKLNEGIILSKDIRFHCIFIDGLHQADQVERDIENSLLYLHEDGFVVLHDCNPPTEFHAREHFNYRYTPAEKYWNGTTWKAFTFFRKRKDFYSCCVDSDWGIGIISKTVNLGKPSKVINSFFDFQIFDKNREECLNLLTFEELKKKLK